MTSLETTTHSDDSDSQSRHMCMLYIHVGIGSVDSDIEYDIFDSYADSHGPGSTGGRTHTTLCPSRGCMDSSLCSGCMDSSTLP